MLSGFYIRRCDILPSAHLVSLMWRCLVQIQADERFGVNGHRYVGGGDYEPIGEVPSHAYHHPQYQQPGRGNEIYAGQSYQQSAIQQPQQQVANSQDRKGAPPPYGAV